MQRILILNREDLGFIPGTSLLGPVSLLPLSLLPCSLLPRSRLPLSLLALSWLPLSLLPLSRLSVMLATRRTDSLAALPSPLRSCDSLLKLLLVIWFPSRLSLRVNRLKRSLSWSLRSRSLPRSRLELDLKLRETKFATCFIFLTCVFQAVIYKHEIVMLCI